MLCAVELQGLGDMVGLGDVDRVDRIVAQRAGLGDRVEGVAGSIGEEWSHDRRARFIAVSMSVMDGGCRPDRRDSLNFGKLPALSQGRADAGIVVEGMAGSTQRDSFDQLAINGLVELIPERVRGPARIAGEATTGRSRSLRDGQQRGCKARTKKHCELG